MAVLSTGDPLSDPRGPGPVRAMCGSRFPRWKRQRRLLSSKSICSQCLSQEPCEDAVGEERQSLGR